MMNPAVGPIRKSSFMSVRRHTRKTYLGPEGGISWGVLIAFFGPVITFILPASNLSVTMLAGHIDTEGLYETVWDSFLGLPN